MLAALPGIVAPPSPLSGARRPASLPPLLLPSLLPGPRPALGRRCNHEGLRPQEALVVVQGLTGQGEQKKRHEESRRRGLRLY